MIPACNKWPIYWELYKSGLKPSGNKTRNYSKITGGYNRASRPAHRLSRLRHVNPKIEKIYNRNEECNVEEGAGVASTPAHLHWLPYFI